MATSSYRSPYRFFLFFLPVCNFSATEQSPLPTCLAIESPTGPLARYTHASRTIYALPRILHARSVKPRPSESIHRRRTLYRWICRTGDDNVVYRVVGTLALENFPLSYLSALKESMILVVAKRFHARRSRPLRSAENFTLNLSLVFITMKNSRFREKNCNFFLLEISN